MHVKAIAFAAMLIGSGAAHAAEQPSARELFRQMDVNGDRALQFEELKAARAELFDRMDANHDGLADPSELRDLAAERTERDVQWARTAEFAAQRQRIDANGDGNISKEEFVAFVPDRLLNADSDGDRSLSLTELRSLRRK